MNRLCELMEVKVKKNTYDLSEIRHFSLSLSLSLSLSFFLELQKDFFCDENLTSWLYSVQRCGFFFFLFSFSSLYASIYCIYIYEKKIVVKREEISKIMRTNSSCYYISSCLSLPTHHTHTHTHTHTKLLLLLKNEQKLQNCILSTLAPFSCETTSLRSCSEVERERGERERW